MEKVIDFDSWLKDFSPRPVDYYVIYNNKTGEVTGIYPEHSCKEIDNKIKIDSDLANSIFEGAVLLSNCFVDLSSDSIEVIQNASLTKIDDILHRIPEIPYTVIEDPDLKIEFISNEKKIKISLSESIKNKRIKWSGDTRLKFLLTEYNDPHKIHDVISFTLDEIYKSAKEFPYNGPSGRFSIFTNRILKTYIFEKI
jgi:hypothetical protein